MGWSAPLDHPTEWTSHGIIYEPSQDSEFFGHAFYEAASIRKINGRYYFIYSSENSNELCYATSQNYNGPYHFGGTIISNGDVGNPEEGEKIAPIRRQTIMEVWHA